MPVLPKHAVDVEHFDDATLKWPVGSGPYVVADAKGYLSLASPDGTPIPGCDNPAIDSPGAGAEPVEPADMSNARRSRSFSRAIQPRPKTENVASPRRNDRRRASSALLRVTESA